MAGFHFRKRSTVPATGETTTATTTTTKKTHSKTFIGRLTLWLLNLALTSFGWFIIFISTAVAQLKANDFVSSISSNGFITTRLNNTASSRLYSFTWWALFYQLFVLLTANLDFKRVVTNTSLLTSLVLIALIQAIIISDTYVFASSKSEKGIAAGAIILAIADFIWLFYYAWAEKEFLNGHFHRHDRDLEKNVPVAANTEQNAVVAPVDNTKTTPSISETYNTHATAVPESELHHHTSPIANVPEEPPVAHTSTGKY